MHRGGAFGAEPAFVDGAVRVALDLEQRHRPVGVLLGIGDQRAPDGAIGTNRVGLAGARDPERLPNLGGVRQVESEGTEPGCSGPGGADLQEVATGDLWHPFPPKERRCRLLNLQPTHSVPAVSIAVSDTVASR